MRRLWTNTSERSVNPGTIRLSEIGIYLRRHTSLYLQCRETQRVLAAPTRIWASVPTNDLDLVTSELSLLETLVQPLKNADKLLITAYETLLCETQITLVPITADVLRIAAQIRASTNLKTPDAIHAATARISNSIL